MKEKYEYSCYSSKSFKSKKNYNKNFLSKLLLNTKSKFSNISEDSLKNSKNNELPLIKNSSTPSIYNNNDSYFSKNNISNSKKYHLNQLLFNSINFDNYQKALLNLKELSNNNNKNNSNIILPHIFHEDKKVEDSIFSNINLSKKTSKSSISYSQNNKKHNSFCLNNLVNMNSNKKNDYSKIKENINQSIYNFSKNIIYREIILNEYKSQELNYEEPKFIGDFKYYNKWIKQQLLELKKEIPSEEVVHRTFEKEYKNSKYNKPILSFTSLSISFNCKGKYHLFHIPFEYLPLFYYKNMSYLKFIIASIFKFDNDFENIYIDFDEIKFILSHSKQFNINLDENIEKKEPTLPKNFDYSILNNSKINKKISSKKLTNNLFASISLEKGKIINKESIKKTNTLRSFNKKHSTIINNNHENKIKKLKKIIQEEKNLYKCIYNKFIFNWNTPKYNYEVTVKTPEAIFQVGKTILKAYIDIELIFYLLTNNFKNWDFYISQFIFSYKECHKNIGKLLSKESKGALFSLENLNSFSLLKNSESMKNIKEISKKNKITNSLNSEKIHQISEKSKKYEFIYTDANNINYIKILHNFFISSRCELFKNKFCFDFNFDQMKILNKILRIQGLEHFFKKLIYIDRQTLSLKIRYDELTSLQNEEYLLENHDPNKNSGQICIKMNERNKDIINFTIHFPTLETIKYNNKNYENCFESNYNSVIFDGISLDILDELCKKDFNDWSNILMKNNY